MTAEIIPFPARRAVAPEPRPIRIGDRVRCCRDGAEGEVTEIVWTLGLWPRLVVSVCGIRRVEHPDHVIPLDPPDPGGAA